MVLPKQPFEVEGLNAQHPAVWLAERLAVATPDEKEEVLRQISLAIKTNPAMDLAEAQAIRKGVYGCYISIHNTILDALAQDILELIASRYPQTEQVPSPKKSTGSMINQEFKIVTLKDNYPKFSLLAGTVGVVTWIFEEEGLIVFNQPSIHLIPWALLRDAVQDEIKTFLVSYFDHNPISAFYLARKNQSVGVLMSELLSQWKYSYNDALNDVLTRSTSASTKKIIMTMWETSQNQAIRLIYRLFSGDKEQNLVTLRQIAAAIENRPELSPRDVNFVRERVEGYPHDDAEINRAVTLVLHQLGRFYPE